MLSRIQKVVELRGFTLLDVESFPHKDDSFLKVIVACNDKEHVCWVYNDNDEAVYEGYYTHSYKEAYAKLQKRIS